MPTVTRPGWFLILMTVQVVVAAFLVEIPTGTDGFGQTVTAIWRGLEPFVVVSGVVTWMIVEGAAMLAEAFRKERYQAGRRNERKAWVEWNARRIAAEKRGEHFDEPTPADAEDEQQEELER